MSQAKDRTPHKTPILNPIVEALPATVPFVGPETIERRTGRPFAARLGANESAFGPAPSVIAAMERAIRETWKYGDPENYDLKAAVAALHGVSLENVSVGEGIDGLLSLIARMALEPGSAVVTSEGGYPTFPYFVAGVGGRLVTVPYRDDRQDLEALLDAAIKERARVLYVSNPDNPMGTWWDRGALANLIDRLPDGLLLILDEAYDDTAPEEARLPLDMANPQVLRLRTFSKAYGLAGARVGFALGEAGTIQTFDKIRNHFGVNRTGQVAALAAIGDQDYLTQTVARIAAARNRIAAIARENGLAPIDSATNFVTIDCHRDGAYAKAVLEELAARAVFVRMPGVAPLNRCIRVSCGLDDALDSFAQALPEALKAAQK